MHSQTVCGRRLAAAAALAALFCGILWIGVVHGAASGSAMHPAAAHESVIAGARPYTVTAHAIHLPLIFGPRPQPLLQPINNGDFEAGRVGWSEYSSSGQALIRSLAGSYPPAHAGSWAAVLGGQDDGVAMLSQGVAIPADRACLEYWQWTVSGDACNADYGGIGVNGHWLDVFSLCSGTATAGWVRRQVSMTGYVTNAVVINVAVVNDYSVPSTLYVDDLSLQPTAQCAAGAAQARGAMAADDRRLQAMRGRAIERPSFWFQK